jgi:hypothetical protein
MRRIMFPCARFLFAVAVVAMLLPAPLRASDHDDGETSAKGRARNLTDLFVFREDDQTGNPADATNLVFIMNTNPRSLARQQYFFSATAQYEFHVQRAADPDARPLGGQDLLFRFQFTSPDERGQQNILFTVVVFENNLPVRTQTFQAGKTTPAVPGLGQPTPSPAVNMVQVGPHLVSIFAGLREDPFFFDEEQFFRVRAGLLGRGPVTTFRSADNAIDATKGFNVNAIVMRVPLALLQQGLFGITTFDTWASINALQ